MHSFKNLGIRGTILRAIFVTCCIFVGSQGTKTALYGTGALGDEQLSVVIVDMQSCFRGSEIYNLALYEHLTNAGHKVAFYVRPNAKITKKLTANKIPFKTSSQSSKGSAAGTLKQLALEREVDIFHCTTSSGSRSAHTVARECGGKVILTNHMSRKTPKTALDTVDGLICVNRSLAKQSGNDVKNTKKHAVWIPPFFDEKAFRAASPAEDRVAFYKEKFKKTIKPDIPIITCIAQIGGHKNQALIVRAMGILKNKRGIETQAVFAGHGNTNAIKKIAGENGLNDNVHCVGFTNDVAGILANADINILVSKTEGLGIALVEGAIMRLPSICCNVPGPRAVVVNGKTGITIKPDDAKGLADALEVYCTDPECYETYSNAIYEHFEETFSTKATMKKLLDFYALVLES